MQNKLTALALFLLLGFSVSIGGPVGANPLTGKPDPGAEQAGSASRINPLTGIPASAAPIPAPVAAEAGLFNDTWNWVRRAQREITTRIADYMTSVAADPTPKAVAFGVLFSLFYGAFHIAGPGHGKMVVISYFLTHPAGFAKSLTMGGKIAVTHVVMAIVLVVSADVTIRVLLGGSAAEIQWLRVASFAVIALTGIWMFVRVVRKAAARRRADHARAHLGAHAHGRHSHGHGRRCHLDHFDEGEARRDQNILSLAAGMAPCTGALLVMLFALANDMVAIGVLLVIAISIGMAGAISVIGMACIFARSLMTRFVDADSRTGEALAMVLEFGGAAAITAVGALFTLAAYQAGQI